MTEEKSSIAQERLGKESVEEFLPGYHEANLKRKVRCMTIFAMMFIAFIIITIININSGNVHIGIG